MPEAIRFYTDEHVPRAVADGLRRRGVDVLTCQEARMLSANDKDHLQRAAAERRVIFTQDADFLRLHTKGAAHHGIVYAPQQTSVGRVVQGLMLIHDALAVDEMAGRVEFL